MILIKTENDLFNFNSCVNLYFINNYIKMFDNSDKPSMIYKFNNKEVAGKVYKKIQNKIIELNAKNGSGCIDVEAIIKEVENEMQGL